MTTHGDESPRPHAFDDTGFSTGAASARTSLIPETDDDSYDADASSLTRWHGGLDLGLLILRVALGGIMAAHGLQKIFGLFEGPGIGGFAQVLGMLGFTSQTTLLSWLTGVAELGGGALLILGLFTPIGATAILGVTASIVYLKSRTGFFMSATGGFEFELLLGAVALALLFTGPGRIALDVHTPWRRRPMPFAIVGVLLAAGASVAVLMLFR